MTWLRRISKIWILPALCLALYLPGLSSLPSTVLDKSRYMQATHQMIESGNFIDIRFQEEPRHKKPVGIYWLQVGVS
jgi:4-amino-4-deoxy-L-arabinose transferase-like glycosyltransferase